MKIVRSFPELFVAGSAVCLRPKPITDADGDCLKFPGDCLKFPVEFAKVSDYASCEVMTGFVVGWRLGKCRVWGFKFRRKHRRLAGSFAGA